MNHPAIASLIYDFDKTLSPNNMQEYGFLKGLNIRPEDFWQACREFAVRHRMDSVLAYMYMMTEKARGVMTLSRELFRSMGRTIEYFPGVDTWFDRINAYGRTVGLQVEHYIISSGLTEIIEGTSIAGHFKAIFAASYCYDGEGHPLWPSNAVNYTSKTQFLFRINKGILDITNDRDLNAYTPEDRRPIPFRNMIYFGDGLTDVPSMKMTRSKGGFSIAVYTPDSPAVADDMLIQNRADFALEADYREGGNLEAVIRALLRRIAATDELARIHAAQIDTARARSAQTAHAFDERAAWADPARDGE